MASRRRLAQRLEDLRLFEDPLVELEQYVTPPELAATIIHDADLRGDLDRPVIDLGSGTGMLAIAAAVRTDQPVIGLELDEGALRVARVNAERLGVEVGWVCGDVDPIGLCPPEDCTVIMNPPFGAQIGRRGADRAFLRTAAAVSSVSYSIHNEGSRSFIEAFVDDLDGVVTHAFMAELELPYQFAHHEEAQRVQPVEVYRIVWNGD